MDVFWQMGNIVGILSCNHIISTYVSYIDVKSNFALLIEVGWFVRYRIKESNHVHMNCNRMQIVMVVFGHTIPTEILGLYKLSLNVSHAPARCYRQRAILAQRINYWWLTCRSRNNLCSLCLGHEWVSDGSQHWLLSLLAKSLYGAGCFWQKTAV